MKTTYKMIIFPVVLFWLLFPTWAQAAQISAGSPRLVLTSYATEPEQVYAGESFDLRLRLQNNGDGSLCNVTLSVGNAENNYFIAAENLTVLITELPAGEEKEAVFHLEVQPEAPAQPLSLSLEIAGENTSGQSWQTEESVTIPVRQRLRLQAGDPVWDPESSLPFPIASASAPPPACRAGGVAVLARPTHRAAVSRLSFPYPRSYNFRFYIYKYTISIIVP